MSEEMDSYYPSDGASSSFSSRTPDYWTPNGLNWDLIIQLAQEQDEKATAEETSVATSKPTVAQPTYESPSVVLNLPATREEAVTTAKALWNEIDTLDKEITQLRSEKADTQKIEGREEKRSELRRKLHDLQHPADMRWSISNGEMFE